MRNKSEVAPTRPAKMNRRDINEVLGRIVVGDRFRVWYPEHGYFTEKVVDGKNVLWFGTIELDDADADAVREDRPLEFQMMSPPRFDGVGEATLLHNGKMGTFVYDAQGIHHIEILS